MYYYDDYKAEKFGEDEGLVFRISSTKHSGSISIYDSTGLENNEMPFGGTGQETEIEIPKDYFVIQRGDRYYTIMMNYLEADNINNITDDELREVVNSISQNKQGFNF